MSTVPQETHDLHDPAVRAALERYWHAIVRAMIGLLHEAVMIEGPAWASGW